MHHEVRLRRRRGGERETMSVSIGPDATLMDAARAAGLPIASACGGDALCARCGLEIRAGAEHLSEEGPAETEAKRRNRVAPELRLACLARVRGPVEATASYW